MIESIAQDIFCIHKPFQLGGLDIGLRATVVRLKDGSLWIYSPVPLDEGELEYIRSQGEVSVIVGPNQFHHLHLRQAKEHFPKAKVYFAPGLDKKRANFNFDGAALEQSWTEDLELCFIEGMPAYNELVAYHKPSETLIVCDLFFNLKNVKGLRGLLLSRAFGTYNRPAISRLFRFFIKDHDAFCRSLQKVDAWKITNIAMAHGDLFQGNGREIFDSLAGRYLGR